MKPRFLAAALSGLSCAGSLLGLPAALAYTTEHGSACRSGGTLDGQNVFLVASASGLTNHSLVTLQVVCPIVRTDPSDGITVWVDGYSGVASASCTLYSRSVRNVLLGAVSSSGGAGFAMRLTLPASQVPRDSSQVVVCRLPSGGVIWDIRSVNSTPIRFPGLVDDFLPIRSGP